MSTSTVNVTGPASNPQITFSSVARPAAGRDRVAHPVRQFGRQPVGDPGGAARRLAQQPARDRAADSTRSASCARRPASTGCAFSAPTIPQGRGTALAAGKYITDDIYLEVITDARGFTATQLEVALIAQPLDPQPGGRTRATNVNVRYRKTY